MKTYKAEIYVDGDNFDILFECDKEKNKECNKKNCDYCYRTTDTRYAKCNADNKEINTYLKAKERAKKVINKDINDKEIIIYLENEIDYYRSKIKEIEIAREENIKKLKKEDYLIQKLQDTLFQVLFVGKTVKDICENKTPNQIRELFGFDKIVE